MSRTAKLTVFLLWMTTLLGSARGLRLISDPGGDSVMFPYPDEAIEISVFTNYPALGWVIFLLIGIFSLVGVLCRRRYPRLFAYMAIMEGIFITSLTILHIIVSGIGLIHLLFALPIGLGLIICGVLLTPREF
ncbi:MAG: hypothetical protein JO301_17420 [Chitinophagaceae bacterium]|nr:hypothetical protein [Chitinophagaceae bacterium]